MRGFVAETLAACCTAWLAACGSSSGGGSTTPEGAIAPSALEEVGGCGDVTLYARAADGTLELGFFSGRAVEAAVAAGGAATLTFELPDEAVRLQLLSGEGLFIQCNDVFLDETRVDVAFQAAAGTAVLDVEVLPEPEPLMKVDGDKVHDVAIIEFDLDPGSPPSGQLATATLRLVDVVFRAEDGREATLAEFAIVDELVGFSVP